MQVFPLVCSRCGEPMRIIAFGTDVGSIHRILAHLGASPHAYQPEGTTLKAGKDRREVP